jgi:branched-chain amino acid aminotransferase
VAPVIEVDGRMIGSGKPGDVTLALQRRYLEVVRGDVPEHPEWRTPVYENG